MRDKQNIFCEDYIVRCRENLECEGILGNLESSCFPSKCPGSIQEMQRCAKKQREVIQFMNNQSPDNTRFFDCECTGGGKNCDAMPVLLKNFHDCDQNSDSWSYECDSHYKSCIDQDNAIECGIPLLNISISCHLDNGTCDRESCISAVGQFFFANGGNFEFTSNLFKCCEHEHKCTGYPAHIYSPWECLQSDPFYSCNQVYKECKDSNDGCFEAYQAVLDECPEEILNPMSSECPFDKITPKCRENAEHLEGWYCSCKNEYEYDELGNGSGLALTEMSPEDKTSCLKYHRIFTHNNCLRSTDVSPTLTLPSAPVTVTQPPSIQVVSIICCAVLGSTLLAIFCYCAWKLHRNRQFGGQTYSHGHSCRNGVNNGSHVAANRSIISNGMRNGATENLISFSDRDPTSYAEVEKESNDTQVSELPGRS